MFPWLGNSAPRAVILHDHQVPAGIELTVTSGCGAALLGFGDSAPDCVDSLIIVNKFLPNSTITL